MGCCVSRLWTARNRMLQDAFHIPNRLAAPAICTYTNANAMSIADIWSFVSMFRLMMDMGNGGGSLAGWLHSGGDGNPSVFIIIFWCSGEMIIILYGHNRATSGLLEEERRSARKASHYISFGRVSTSIRVGSFENDALKRNVHLVQNDTKERREYGNISSPN